MIELVNILLNVSRIDLGTFAISTKPTDIRQVINAVLREVDNKRKSKHIEIKTHYSAGVDKLDLDPNLILIILENLVTNAIKYNKQEGWVSIDVHKDTEKLVISVADSGLGIPPEEQKYIFSKLFRAGNIKNTIPEGNGLGLYLVKSIIENAGGDITFVSELNKGTTFIITFPNARMQSRGGDKHLDLKGIDAVKLNED
jgi:signal transduction histidine kinase